MLKTASGNSCLSSDRRQGKEELGQDFQEDLECGQFMVIFESLQNSPEKEKVTVVHATTRMHLCKFQRV